MKDNKTKVLIVEDNEDIADLLTDFLEAGGYETRSAQDGVSAIEKFNTEDFGLILLDIMLPKIDGFGVCQYIRSKSNIPIIFLTALESEQNQLKAFDLYADDYITKPFSMPVLLKKIAAVLRRISQSVPQNKLEYKYIVLDSDEYRAYKNGETIELTTREFEILRELIENKGRVLTREYLLNSVWNYNFLGDERIIDTHIKNLRKKIGEGLIKTVRGVGYRIDK